MGQATGRVRAGWEIRPARALSRRTVEEMQISNTTGAGPNKAGDIRVAVHHSEKNFNTPSVRH